MFSLGEQTCASFLQKEEPYIYTQLLRQTPEFLQRFRDGQVRFRTIVQGTGRVALMRETCRVVANCSTARLHC